MFDEEYEKLGIGETESFKRIVNSLLGHTYILSKNYAVNNDEISTNPDYAFILRNFDLFRDYFAFAGFRIEADADYGVIHIESEHDDARFRMNKLTTQILYSLRLIFDDVFSKLQTSKYVVTSVGQINQTLRDTGVIQARMNIQSMAESFRILKRFRVIEKGEGDWTSDKTKIVILPTILFIVPGEKVNSLARLVDSPSPEAQEAEDANQPEEDADEEA